LVKKRDFSLIDGFYAIDYQVHSFRSHDGKATIRQQCERAVEVGLDEIGFSEHKDFDPADPVVDYFNYAQYVEEIEQAREEFRGRLTIRMGVEVDYQKWFEGEIATYLQRHPFDFVIGSVHYVDRVMLMTPEYVKDRTAEQAYRLYFDAIRESVNSGLIDILGHLEYANRRGVGAYGPYDPTPYHEQLAEVFDLMMAKGVALEINTAGLRQGVGLTYPCEEHIALYAERGGKLLTIGSDSHHPDDLAASYSVAAGLALKYGLNDLTIWGNRVPTKVQLKQA
jgi:histidinol-phosphatase (PHP family)